MKRAPVYSSRGKPTPNGGSTVGSTPEQAEDAAPPKPPLRKRIAAFYRRREPLVLFFIGLLIAGAAALAVLSQQNEGREYTQEDIDAAVMHTIDNKTLPSRAAKAAELVRQSVVRVNGFDDDPPRGIVRDEHKDARDRLATEPKTKPESKDSKDSQTAKDGRGADGQALNGRNGKALKDPKIFRDPEGPNQAKAKDAPVDPKSKDGKGADDKQARKSDDSNHPEEEKQRGRVGTGVVIVDTGIILTNLHVVAGAKRLTVTFYDGMESEAEVIAAQPENDLAVIRAKKLPDDLPAATLGSSARLMPGDDVVAVGFPFGIGPSVSAGVVSGLNRGFRSGDGKRQLSRLIQFDAAVNPGNSGGPLITMDGEVVGIVTAIFNPTEARTFIGIGFAATIESAGAAVGIPPF